MIERIQKTLNDYVAFRTNPGNDHITDGVWCEEQIRIDDLMAWKLANPQAMLSILEKRRSAYSDDLIKIDQALLQKAKAGDPRSIELVWARYEGWSPKIEENNSKQGLGKNKTLADLMGEL